jgi:hypothetical protein
MPALGLLIVGLRVRPFPPRAHLGKHSRSSYAWREFAIDQNSASVSPVLDITYGTPGRPFGSDHVPGSFHIKKRELVAWVVPSTWYRESLSPWKFGFDCEPFGPGGPGFGTSIAKSTSLAPSGLM